MHFGFMLERGSIDAVFILGRLQGEYNAKGKKLYMCFVDLKKAFDSVLRKVLELAMRKKGIPVVLVRSVMSLYEGAKKWFEWILSCHWNLRLKWGCTNNLRYHHFFLHWW